MLKKHTASVNLNKMFQKEEEKKINTNYFQGLVQIRKDVKDEKALHVLPLQEPPQSARAGPNTGLGFFKA